MSISSPTREVEYIGNGSSVTYPYPFRILKDTDLVVTVDGSVLASGYSVTGVGSDAGGNVVFDTAPVDQAAILIERIVPLDQLTQYEDYDPFSAKDHEDALDKLTMIDQQQQAELDHKVEYDIQAGDGGKVLEVNSTETAVVAISSAQDIRNAETNSAASASAALSSQNAALASQNAANKWATAPEDNQVNDGVNPANFSAYHYMRKAQSVVSTGVELRNGIIAGTGDVVTDLNAMDWTGHPYAVGTAFEILDNSVVQFQHNGELYDWFGIKGVTVGLGGTKTALASDLFLRAATNAISITFDPNNTSLTKTNVQEAIDEVVNTTIPAATAAVMTGYKNVLINGNFRINQREFDGDWNNAAMPIGDFGFDRWHKLGGGTLAQKVEVNNMMDGETYTVTAWHTNIGDSAVIGITAGDDTLIYSGFSPHTFVYDRVLHGTLRIDTTDSSKYIQLELASVATNFEVRPIGLELALCQRYYWPIPKYQASIISATSNFRIVQITFPTEMRVTPVIADSWTAGTTSQVFLTAQGFTARTDTGDTTSQPNYNGGTADAEIV